MPDEDLLNITPDEPPPLVDADDATPESLADIVSDPDAHAADTSPAATGDVSIPAGLRSRLPTLDDTTGVYVVLWARKPHTKSERPQWHEVAFVKASGPAVARARALEHDGPKPKPFAERGDVARYLIERAGEKPGILLRAIPAMHWPAEVDDTSMVRPDPILKVG